jgi:hypothetical protein
MKKFVAMMRLLKLAQERYFGEFGGAYNVRGHKAKKAGRRSACF